jgi:microcystin-dependent protein
MSNPYVGEIRMFGGNFPPAGWMFCDGSLLSIAENETLFNLIGTTYGGDGQSTFALPDLRGRVPIHQGQGAGLSPHVLGESLGAETVTLTQAQLPAHAHPIAATGTATLSSPAGSRYGTTGTNATYIDTAPNAQFAPEATVSAGGGQPHENMMPFLCVSFIISLFGIFPSQS